MEIAKQLETKAQTEQILEARKRERILGAASNAGIMAGLGAAAFVGAGVLAA